jgi:hypothetical protein
MLALARSSFLRKAKNGSCPRRKRPSLGQAPGNGQNASNAIKRSLALSETIAARRRLSDRKRFEFVSSLNYFRLSSKVKAIVGSSCARMVELTGIE